MPEELQELVDEPYKMQGVFVKRFEVEAGCSLAFAIKAELKLKASQVIFCPWLSVTSAYQSQPMLRTCTVQTHVHSTDHEAELST